jgi:dihydroorotase
MSDPSALSIRGGRVIDPASGLDTVTDVHIAAGVVVGIGDPPAGHAPGQEIDAAGLVVCPGLVDLSARLRQPGEEHKATVASETRAAAAAGVTTLCCPPDTLPPVDTPAVAQLIIQLAEARGLARVLPAGALTHALAGEQLSEMAALKLAGCVVMSNGDQPVRNTRVLRRALEYAYTYGLCTFMHPADPYLSEGGIAHEGLVATRLGLPSIPEATETLGVARNLALGEQTGARLHFRGLSTAHAAAMIGDARERRMAVSADVSAHQLWLTEEAVNGFNADAHLIPPLRTKADRDGLRAALAAGAVTAICSDHRPHEPDAKLRPFPQTEPGMSALETLLPLTLALVAEDVLDLRRALACVTCNPADILERPVGRLQAGAIADLCIFDPDETWVVGDDTLVSRGKNTPLRGATLRGRVRTTLLAGRVVFQREG